MPRVGFEPTIPVFERAKMVHSLDRAATVIGTSSSYRKDNPHGDALTYFSVAGIGL
jgi:hypothetical protein